VVIFRQDVSGIFGAAAQQGGIEAMLGNNISLTAEQQEAGVNRAPKQLDLEAMDNLDNTAYRVLADEENKTVFVVAKADRLRFSGGGSDTAMHGEQYNASFNVSADYLSEFQRGDGEDDETASDNFGIVDRTAQFSEEPVMVEPAPDQNITGETTVAPGTELTVRARATGQSPFLKTATATVAEDGSFAAAFDGEASFEGEDVGQQFTLTIPRQSFEDNAETQGQVGEGEEASVSISDQTAQEGEELETITVDSASLPRGGFITIHDGTLNDGATFDSVRGTSDYIEQGQNGSIEVSLDDPYTEKGEAIAMAHRDTNSNQEYDFVDTEGDEDGPYTNADGDAVIDSASVTFDPGDGNGTTTPTETPGGPTETETPTETDGGEDDQAGFGAVVALIALLGAALLAARRDAF
jgi:PGF-CTERM protein